MPPKSRSGVWPQLVRGRYWVARWVDPVTGKTKQCAIPSGYAATQANRARFCSAKLADLTKIRRAVANSRGAIELMSIEQLGAEFLQTNYAKPNSRRARQSRVNAFVDWCTRRKIAGTDDVRPRDVIAWSDYCHHPDRGHKPTTANSYVKVIAKMLRWAIERDRCPLLTSAEISDRAKLAAEPKPAKDFLRTGHGITDAPNEVADMLRGWIADDEAYAGADTAHVGLALLLTGCRKAELLGDPDNGTDPLSWAEVRFDRGCIELSATRVKNGQAREIYFKETPALADLLQALHDRSSGEGAVFGNVTIPMLDLAVKRVRTRTKRYFTAQTLRRTCAMILVNAPTIYSVPGMPAAASLWMATQRLGHTVQVAQQSYLKQRIELPANAQTLERAASIEALVSQIMERVRRRGLKSASGAA